LTFCINARSDWDRQRNYVVEREVMGGRKVGGERRVVKWKLHALLGLGWMQGEREGLEYLSEVKGTP